MMKIVWPLLIFLGILFVVAIDAGSGLSSPGLWLIPIGVLGGIKESVKRLGMPRSKPLIICWAIAFFAIFGLWVDSNYELLTEGFDTFIWIPPAIGFTLVGLVYMIVNLYRKK